ncbi:hypothetical protein G7Y89_g9538 [Cudoniella acicularis]|uniref:DUF6536 domain-containing protein n=1 Tax=Cudoniella acicularis TaxID=354080 RepID=A0A8H4W1T2_9HELO|nr:hypothetical protein G7Y89_g9538 [Cudoniella acicularis]
MSGQYNSQWIPMQPPQWHSEASSPSSQKPSFQGNYTEVAGNEGGKSSYRTQTFMQKYLGGIKRTLRAFVAVACIVLIVNLAWLFYAKSKYGIVDGFGTIQSGECSKVKGLSTWYHLLINILSTLLLTGSNAFMAAYSCPSREEVDRAHQRGRFLHVGSLSFGNLKGVAKRRGLVVLALAISSAPFHLLYNSLVFTSLSSNQYYWTVVTEGFLTGAPFNLTGDWAPHYYGQNTTFPTFTATTLNTSVGIDFLNDGMQLQKAMVDYFDNIQTSAPSWERLENKDCLQAYSNVFLSERRNVVLVSSSKNNTNSILKYGDADWTSGLENNWWICSKQGNDGGSQTCNAETYMSSASNWTVYDFPIEYCLSERTTDTCSVNFSMTIMIVVVAFNAFKVALMLWVLFRYDAENILTSVGDAAASFLLFEDQTTMQMCLADKRDLRRFWQARGFAKPFDRRKRHWGSAVSKKRWTSFFCLMILAFLLVVFFAGWGFIHVRERGTSLDPVSLWNLGFGEVNQNAMVIYGGYGGNGDAVTMAVLANIPQVFLALVYLQYMGIVTSMFLAADWSVFAFKPQTLMVSTPSGKQRGTWLLGAPLAWGIPLLALQTLLHWFLSQSIFMVQTAVYDKDGKPLVYDTNDFNDYSHVSNCGYSPIAIIFSVVATAILLLSAVIFMFRRFPAGSPPVVSTCSAAISASCHPMVRDEEMRYKELRWGVRWRVSEWCWALLVGYC